MKLSLFAPLLLFLSCTTANYGQRLTREQIEDTVLPSFSIYKDNFFITGIPTHTGISKETADAKYQISFKQLLTRHTLPFDSQLFFIYTQKALGCL